MSTLVPLLATLLLCPAQESAPVAKTRVVLKDGRVLEGKVADTAEAIEVTLKNGSIKIPDELIETVQDPKSVKYEPKNDYEREQLAKGFVLFQGSWMAKSRMEDMLAKRREADEKRIADFLDHTEWRNAYTKDTKHFRFRANCPPDRLEVYAQLLEEYYNEFTKAWGITATPKEKPRVCVYRNADDFKNISGAPHGVVGWFRSATNELHVYWDESDPDMAFDVLFHEGNHLLTHMIEPGFNHPHWLNEAMAEYYGASEFKKGKVVVGAIQEGRLVEIQQDLNENFTEELENLVRGERDYRAYTWGWSFVHFLMSNPKYEKKIKSYFIGLARADGISRKTESFLDEHVKIVEPEEQLKYMRRLFGNDLGALEKEWHTYVKEKLKLVTGRGYFLAAQRARREIEDDKALKFINKAIELGDQRAETYALQGKILHDAGEDGKAVQAYLKATEIAPTTAIYYYELGEVLLSDKDDTKKKEGQRYQALAGELDPSSPWLRWSLRRALQGD